MALPGDVASTTPVIADYISPYNRFSGALEDFEAGGIALNDGSQGLDVQIWHLIYNDDDQSPNYGDFTVTAENTGESSVVLNVPGVTRVGLAFNQNMDIFIAYETRDCEAKYFWYDTAIADHTTSSLPVGSYSLACCLDDHRITQTGASDIILAYIRDGTLYYRQERDRFTIERALGSPGAAILDKVGMTRNLRLKFEVFEGAGVRLSHIVGELCERVGVTANKIDVEELYPILVRGWKSAGLYAAADAIRGLQLVYFFDMPMIDGKLTAVPRGGEVVGTITQDDLVVDREFRFTDAREQGVEFPKYVRLAHANAENDYTPSTARSERRSRDIKSKSEHVVESAVNHTPQDAAERVDILHKILWAEFEGRAKFSISEAFAERVPSNLINFEVRPGVFKRMRIALIRRVDGVMDCEAVIDRASAYVAGSISLPETIPPETPPPTLSGDTIWEFMNLPALVTSHDGLNAYMAGHGAPGTAWHGARVQRLVGADWETFGDIPAAEIMGQVEVTLPAATAYGIDTTNQLLVSLNVTPPGFSSDLLFAGKGAWLIGNEIVQVRDWAATGDNWLGTYMMRGRLDTAPATHPPGTRAVYLGNPARVPVDAALLDTLLTLRAVSLGQAGADAEQDDFPYGGLTSEEWPPEMLVAEQDGNDWDLSWIPRYRLGNSANPIPSANFYGWRLRFTVGSTTVTKETAGTTPSYTFSEADQVAGFGSAQSSFDSVEIRALNLLGGEGKALIEAVS